VIFQPFIRKQAAGIPQAANELIDNHEDPNRQMIDLVVHRSGDDLEL
jgi:hypothetical protein